MSKTIVFKQSFKARADPSTPGLNVRHLQYIATRPGAVYNHGCGFGLWGHLPDDGGIRIQSDLERAKRVVRSASANHTMYRSIISVGKADAENHGLYRRERWEQLINDNINAIAKEMDIKPENLCWCASMHYAKHHPHVHILYWDNSDQPRPDFIKKDLFEQKTEHIRAAFSGSIHREEIRELQQEQREQMKILRAAIQAMCREANPEKALDLPRLYRSDRLSGITQQLAELLQELPSRGSLRYAYLPEACKEMVNGLIDACLEVPELAREYVMLETATRQVSALYSNGSETSEKAVHDAKEKLYRELGNEVMSAVREILADIRASPPGDREEVQAFLKEILCEATPILDAHQELISQISGGLSGSDGIYDAANRLVDELLGDPRIRLRFQAFAVQDAGIDLESKQSAPRKLADSGNGMHILDGKLVTGQEWEDYLISYRGIKRDLRNAIMRDVIGSSRTGMFDSPDVRMHFQDLVRSIVHDAVPSMELYHKLRSLLPQERIPIRAMESQIEGYHQTMNQLLGTVLMDARIRMRIQAYALEIAGVNIDESPEEGHIQNGAPESSGHSLYGRSFSVQEWKDYQDAYREAKREIRRAITEQVRQDAGWTYEAVRSGSAFMLCAMLRLLSQASNQQKTGAVQARNYLKTRSKDGSREAKQDYRSTQTTASEWGD